MSGSSCFCVSIIIVKIMPQICKGDFIDLGYPAKYGKAFSLLRDYDMLEYQSTILAPTYNVSDNEESEEQTKLVTSFF